MKNWSTYIFLLVAGALSLLATSCSQEDEGLESVIASQGKATIQFSIALGDSGASSRATWGDQPYNDDPNVPDTDETNYGNEFENTINPGQFHVSLIIPGTSSDTIPVKLISRLDDTNDYQYTFKGEVIVENKQSLKGANIQVFANLTEDEFDEEELLFATNYNDYPGTGRNNIPMWGVHTITSDLVLAGGNTIDLRSTPIYLLRSMAKVEVIINPALTDFTIESVGLNKYNEKGYLKPSNTGEEVNTKDYNREECINAFSSLKSYPDYTGLPFTYNQKSKSYILYVPEYDNPKQKDEDDAVIFLSIKKGGKYISTQLGSNGAIKMTDLNLVRNHWYQYYINSINIETDIQFNFKYQVINWTEINNGELIFGGESGAIHNPEDEEQEEE